MRSKFASHRRLGERAELTFMARAAGLGFIISKPLSDVAPYDVVLEKDGHVWLIQVKSVHKPLLNGAFQIHNFVHSGVLRPYRRREADFIAAWIVPLNVWYLIPVSAANRMTLYLRPDKKPGKGRFRFERFRESWQLLDLDTRKRDRRRLRKDLRSL